MLTAAPAWSLPPGFAVDNVGPVLDTPTCLAFLPDGRLLVGEKQGRVVMIKNGIRLPAPVWLAEAEVLNEGDLGLMSVAVDPAFSSNRYIYLLYTVDPDSNGVDDNPSGFGRLVRYQMSAVDTNVVDPASRTILMGASWSEGPLAAELSHTVGALRFGADGTLLVSIGEGASAGGMDAGGGDPDAFAPGRTDPAEDIGAFRAQYRGSLAGKILRLDPATGHGLPSNPFADTLLTAPRSKVWAYGLRNPFRFAVRPGTGSPSPAAADPGTLIVSDVGWFSWEEIDVVDSPGRNYGWPCFEGSGGNPPYQAATPAHDGCASIGTPTNPGVLQPPLLEWSHTDSSASVPPGIVGNSAIAGTFYTGTQYPPRWQGAFFFADFGHEWIQVAKLSPAGTVDSVLQFADEIDGPVDFAIHPQTGDLYYVIIQTQRVQHLRFDAALADLPPVAVATGTPAIGEAPLNVTFSSAGSMDPEGGPIDILWSFGDNSFSTSPNPAHNYAAVGSYEAILIVTDSLGHSTQDTVLVEAHGPGPFPAKPVIDNFNRPDGPLGGAWVGEVDAVVIRTNALDPPSGFRSLVNDTEVYGPNQEAYVTLKAITATATDHDLMLKIQGTSWTAGHIEVRYDHPGRRVVIGTYQPGIGWVQRGLISSITFSAGQRLGARAFADGRVEVYRNTTKLGTASVAAWPFFANGGRIGITVGGAGSSLLDDFGGGSFATGPNQPPTSAIVSPSTGSFFARGDTVRFQGAAGDGEDAASALSWSWRVDLHHNTHVHPSFMVSSAASPFFVMDVHDDGTGVHYEARFIVTDTGGARDTAYCEIYPEVDLAPTPVALLAPVGADAPLEVRFAITNPGGMPSPFANWKLYTGSTLLAQGDTICPARDSVIVQRTIASSVPAGWRTFHVVLDTAATIVETNEDNNGVSITSLVPDHAFDTTPPAFSTGPAVTAFGGNAVVRWSTSEWASGAVLFGTTLALPGTVTVGPDTSQEATLTKLTLGTRYYYRVRAEDPHGNWAESPVDSFWTVSGPLDAPNEAPGVFALSNAYPNPSRGAVEFRLDLPSAADIGFDVHDLQGRLVWRAAMTRREAGRWTLRWPGITTHGARAAPALYLARVRVNGTIHLRRVALLQ